MKGIEGLYSAINAIISEMEGDGFVVISTEEVTKRLRKDDKIDFESASVRELIDFACNSAVMIGLNRAGYRSVIKGDGYYVNPEICKKPIFLIKLYNNENEKAMQDENIAKGLLQIAKEASKSIPGQLRFTESGNIVEEYSQEQTRELLQKLSKKEKDA